jgi:uncharacterized membrane protein (DUF485 family)
VTSDNHDQPTRHDPIYDELHASPEFAELRRRYRSFAFPATVAFLLWYLLYVVMSNWAHDFMSHQLFGHVNVALVFGILQFVSTFAIARLYATHADRELDPLAERLREQYERELGGEGVARPGEDREARA